MLRYIKYLFRGARLINAESVKAKLKNRAKENGMLFQEVLTTYCLERTIYRLSVSKYNDQFTLKGGIFLYAMFNGEFTRATSDIDLLGTNIENSIDTMKEIFENVLKIDISDAIVFDLNTLEIKKITEFKDYSGVNVSVIAMLDKTKVSISIDIGFGDIVYPKRNIMEFPSLLGMETAKIYTYSLETVIAEKLEAIVSLGYVNSRYKDFYDIYLLSRNFDFEGKELAQAIKITFEHRKTGLDDIVAFESDFVEDRTRVLRWNSFVKKKHAMVQVKFSEVIGAIKAFLEPVIISLKNEDLYDGTWECTHLSWKKYDIIKDENYGKK